jgi:hypothetical protein
MAKESIHITFSVVFSKIMHGKKKMWMSAKEMVKEHGRSQGLSVV